MDQKEVMMIGGGGGWTEERHAAFLNCIEESFVNRMFNAESSDVACFSGATCRRRILPLDREIPDSVTESTCDSGSSKSRHLVESDNEDLVVLSKTNRKKKRQLSRLDRSHDQVVPLMGSYADNSKKKRRV